MFWNTRTLGHELGRCGRTFASRHLTVGCVAALGKDLDFQILTPLVLVLCYALAPEDVKSAVAALPAAWYRGSGHDGF